MRQFNAPVSSRAVALNDGGTRQNGLIGSLAKPLTFAAFAVRRIDGGIWVPGCANEALDKSQLN